MRKWYDKEKDEASSDKLGKKEVHISNTEKLIYINVT